MFPNVYISIFFPNAGILGNILSVKYFPLTSDLNSSSKELIDTLHLAHFNQLSYMLFRLVLSESKLKK